MRTSALFILLLSLTADAQGRFERFCGRTAQGRSDRGFPCDDGAFFEAFNATASNVPCSTTAPVAVGYGCPSGGCLSTTTRASVAECPSNDGQSLTQLAANVARVSSGNALTTRPGIWKEYAATNAIWPNRDLSPTSGRWTATNMTCVRNAPGMRGGDVNGATTCVASAANATICQALVFAAAPRSTSWRIKKSLLTGALTLARDGATYGADISSQLSSTLWKWAVPWSSPGCAGGNCIIQSTLTSSVLNPNICLKIANSGDSVMIDFVQDESGYRATSPIETTVATATRALETTYFTVPTTAIRSLRVSFIAPGYAGQFNAPVFAWQDGSNAFTIWMPNASDVNQNYGCLNLRTGLNQAGGFTYAPTSSESFNSIACDLTDATAQVLNERGVSNSTATASTAVPSVTRIYVGGAEPTGYGAPYDMAGVFRDLCADPVVGKCPPVYDSIGQPIAAVGDSLTYGLNQGTSRWVYTLGQALNRPIYNIGFTGNTTAQCLAAFNTSVLGKSYTGVTVLCGINDLIAGVSATTIMATLTTLFDAARAAGLRLTIGLIPPWSGAAGWDAAKQTQTVALNAALVAYGSANGVNIANLYDALRTGTALNALYDSGDGIHWNGTGATVAAAEWQGANP